MWRAGAEMMMQLSSPGISASRRPPAVVGPSVRFGSVRFGSVRFGSVRLGCWGWPGFFLLRFSARQLAVIFSIATTRRKAPSLKASSQAQTLNVVDIHGQPEVRASAKLGGLQK